MRFFFPHPLVVSLFRSRLGDIVRRAQRPTRSLPCAVINARATASGHGFKGPWNTRATDKRKAKGTLIFRNGKGLIFFFSFAGRCRPKLVIMSVYAYIHHHRCVRHAYEVVSEWTYRKFVSVMRQTSLLQTRCQSENTRFLSRPIDTLLMCTYTYSEKRNNRTCETGKKRNHWKKKSKIWRARITTFKRVGKISNETNGVWKYRTHQGRA